MELMTNERFQRTLKYVRAALLIGMILAIFLLSLFLGVLLYAKIKGPPPLAVPQSTLYYSADEVIIGESNSGEKRYWVTLDDISPALIQSTLAVEDKSFYDHNGFDFKRIAGAVLADVKAMAKVQGASTITQQYARNLYLSHDKTWQRKFNEAFFTIRMEMNYSKADILEGYLNTIYYGHGAYGIEAASQFYFGKSAKELSLAQSAMLAGIPKAPGHYSPIINEAKAKDRQAIVLSELERDEKITLAEKQEAKQEALEYIGRHEHSVNEIAGSFQERVKNILKNQLNIDEAALELGGLSIYTTLNTKHQEVAEKAVKDHMPDTGLQVGFTSINPKNGYVTAMVGGLDFEESPFNRAVQAQRQPGSTIKPLLYYAALETGFTPSTTMRSELTTFKFDDGQSEYTPHNYDNRYADGSITLPQAIGLSDNVFAVKTHMFIGEEALVDTAKKFGLTSEIKPKPSAALGTYEASVIEMVNAYALLANGGKEIHPVFITKVVSADGKIIYEHKQKKEQLLNPDLAFVLTHMMEGTFDPKLNEDYARVTGSTVLDEITRTYSGKSGTTNWDNWMIGSSPQLTAGVWTGYDDGSRLTKTEDKYPAKYVWAQFMEEALKEEPVKEFKPTGNVVGVMIDPHNGKLATEDCPVARETYYVIGTEPEEYCYDHIESPTEPKEKKDKKKEGKSLFDRFVDFFS
ncbi:transglycosylase domain-containing protein [Bacillus sp. 2205SS5-2]|uniref:transglycosylase domain-containing protein n=1 Tax=Bacillus sp. 2205SS5-2 TaxID=3109031 RepID=UPI003003CFA1